MVKYVEGNFNEDYIQTLGQPDRQSDMRPPEVDHCTACLLRMTNPFLLV